MQKNNYLSDRLGSLQQQLANENQDKSSLVTIAEEFSKLGAEASKTSQDVVVQGAELLGLVSELAANWDSTGSADDSRDELIEFLGVGVAVLDQAIETGDGEENISILIDTAKESWPDYLVDFEDAQFANTSFVDDGGGEGDVNDEDLQAVDSNQIAMMLSTLSGDAQAAGQDPGEQVHDRADVVKDISPVELQPQQSPTTRHCCQH